MTSFSNAPSLEEVYSAICILYESPDAEKRSSAEKWLNDFQRSLYAWSISDEVLRQARDLNSVLFAAHTMKNKIQNSFNELPTDVHESLRTSLLYHCSRVTDNATLPHALVTMFAVALADLLLQMREWNGALPDLIQKFGSDAQYWSFLLEFLKVLPEEARSERLRIGAARRRQLVDEFRSCSVSVLQFFSNCLQQTNLPPTNPSNSNGHVHSANLDRLQVGVFRALSSWLSLSGSGVIDPGAISSNESLRNLCCVIPFKILHDLDCSDELHDATTDYINAALQSFENLGQYLELASALYNSVLELELPYRRAFEAGDSMKVANFVCVFAESGEAMLPLVLDSFDTASALHSRLFSLILNATQNKAHSVARFSLQFWYALCDRLSARFRDRTSDEAMELEVQWQRARFLPMLRPLVLALADRCELSPDAEEAETREEALSFRDRACDLLLDLSALPAFLPSAGLFQQATATDAQNASPPAPEPSNPAAFGSLQISEWLAARFLEQSAQPARLETVESSLYLIAALAENFAKSKLDSALLNACLNLVLSQLGASFPLFAASGQPSATNSVQLYLSAMHVLGELSHWLASPSRPQIIDAVIEFLLSVLSVAAASSVYRVDLSRAAAQALTKVCSANPAACVKQLPRLLTLVLGTTDAPPDSNSTVTELIRCSMNILSEASFADIESIMQQLCSLQLEKLNQVMSSSESLRLGSAAHDPCLYLDRLAAMFSGLQWTPPPGASAHPCSSLALPVWQRIGPVIERFESNAHVVERACRCVRYLLRCLKCFALPLLEHILPAIVQSYNRHPHSCFFYVGSILVDEFGVMPAQGGALSQMLIMFSVPTLTQHLVSAQDLIDKPDVLDDYMRLCTRFLQRAPEQLLFASFDVGSATASNSSSQLVERVLQLALLALSTVQHHDAFSSVQRFFCELVEATTAGNFEPNSVFAHTPLNDYHSRVAIRIRELVLAIGPVLSSTTLEACCLHLPRSLLSDASSILFTLLFLDQNTFAPWLQAAIQNLIAKATNSSDSALRSSAALIDMPQLFEFQTRLLSSQSEKEVYRAIKDFAQHFR